MRQHDRRALDAALRAARVAAYPSGQFVGQESFMSAGEIRWLAVAAGIGPGVSVLDLCCGVAGPGLWITRELGCAYTGVDADAGAIEVARTRAGDLGCRFEVARVPPLPPGPFEVLMLLETMLAFPDKDLLLHAVASALPAGGRFAFTLEAGEPLSDAERRAMPAADTVWLRPLDDVVAGLARAGLRLRRQADVTHAHGATAERLMSAFASAAPKIAARIGAPAVDDLLKAHGLWAEWLRTGRVRKLLVVTESGPKRDC